MNDKETAMLADTLSADETAAELGLHTVSLARWRQQGRGPAYLRIGRRIRYRRADIEQWLEDQRHGLG